MTPFVDDGHTLATLERALPSAEGAVRAELLAAMSWLLRQRDTARALAMADEADTLTRSHAPPEVALRILLVRSEADWLHGRIEAALDPAHHALALAREAGGAESLADAQWLMGLVMAERGQLGLRDAAFEACAQQAEDAGDRTRQLAAEGALARWGALHNPREARQRWAHLANEPAPLGAVTWVRDGLGMLAFAEGDYGSAAVHFIGMHEDAVASGQWQRAVVALANIGIGFSKLHDQEAALQWMERSLDLARSTGWAPAIGMALLQTAYTQRMLRRFDAAEDLLKEARRLLGDRPSSRAVATAERYLAEVQLCRGEYSAALATYTELVARAQQLDNAGLLAVAEGGLALSLAHLGRPEEGLRRAEAALKQCRERGQRCDEIDLVRQIAEIYADHEDRDGAPLGAPGTALRWFGELLRVAESIDGYAVPGEVFDQIAREHARAGDFDSAYEASLAAIKARERTSSDAAINRSIAMQIQQQTERARADARHHRELAQTLQQTTDTLQRLSVIGQEITRHLDERPILQALREHVLGLLDASHFAIYLFDEDAQVLECAFGMEEGRLLPHVRVALNDPVSVVARCARERVEHVRLQAATRSALQVPGTVPTGSAMFAPLLVGERLLGVLSVQAMPEGAYGEREQLIFRTLCAYGAIALDNARGYRRVESTLHELRHAQHQLEEKNFLLEVASREQQEASVTDPLTRLKNRRFLVQAIDSEVGLTLRRRLRAKKASGPAQDTDLVFYLIDIDHFKSVNDVFGHAIGDLVLQQVADRLAQVARDTDFLVRWGGEEFLLVARATDASAAAGLAERLRVAVGEASFEIGHGRRIERSCSIGFAAMPFVPEQPRLLSWAQVVELADHALYVAKQEGRDRWVGVACERAPATGDEAAWLAALLAAPGLSDQRPGLRYLRGRVG
jgi:diguanylate cyclase (GGDEF)-like protein